MKSNEIAFQLRLNENLYAQIKYIARNQHRSMNQQIAFILDLFEQEYEHANGAIERQEIEKILDSINL